MKLEDLEKLRQKIDKIDNELLKLLLKRVQVCKAVGHAKKRTGMPIRDFARENEVYKRIKEISSQLGLDTNQVEAVYHEIVNMCSTVQE